MVKVSAWNIRGLSQADKRAEVSAFIVKNNISFCALLEVKQDSSGWNRVASSCCPNRGWNSIVSDANGGRSRILILWDTQRITVTNVGNFEHFVIPGVVCDSKKWYVITIYANNDLRDRDSL